jgi:sugar phosphate permease
VVDSPKMSFFRPLASSQFWILGLTFFSAYGIVMTFQGLWATPYLMAVLKIDRIAASNLNMIIPIGFIIGSPLFGWITDKIFKKRVRVIQFLMMMLTISWGGIAFGMNLGILWISATLFLMGIAVGGLISLICQRHHAAVDPGVFFRTVEPGPLFGRRGVSVVDRGIAGSGNPCEWRLSRRIL